jgi:hypothetical protein
MRKSACSVSTDIKPKYCRVRRHLSLGVVEVKLVGDDLFLGTSKVKFFLSEKQKRGDRTSGFEVLKDLESMGGIALNYSVLSYLLAHTKLWPRKLWPLPGKRNSFDAPTVYFPGTVFAPASDPLPKERSEAGDWVSGWLQLVLLFHRPFSAITGEVLRLVVNHLSSKTWLVPLLTSTRSKSTCN